MMSHCARSLITPLLRGKEGKRGREEGEREGMNGRGGEGKGGEGRGSERRVRGVGRGGDPPHMSGYGAVRV